MPREALTKEQLRELPDGTRVWCQFYGEGADGEFTEPEWQEWVTVADEPRWPGYRHITRSGHAYSFAELDYRPRGSGVWMTSDGWLEVGEASSCRLFVDEAAGNRDYAQRRNDWDGLLGDLIGATSMSLSSPLPVTAATLARPGSTVVAHGGELMSVWPAHDLCLVIAADLHHPGCALVRRQRPTGEPVSWIDAPQTWTDDCAAVSVSPAELGELLDRHVT